MAEGHFFNSKPSPERIHWGTDMTRSPARSRSHHASQRAAAACRAVFAVAAFGVLILLRHKRRRFVCLIGRMQQGQRERFRTMATISLRRIVAIEFGM